MPRAAIANTLLNPSGLCGCGCGERTNLAKQTNARWGHVKGEPLRYVLEHHRRLSPVEYVVEERGYTTPCWVWQRGRDGSGYGKVRHDGRTQNSHRVYYERAFGPIPDGLQLDHLCRQRDCCNPSHLEPVTHAENGRRGAKVKLTHADIPRIRELLKLDTQKNIASIFGVSANTISDIATGNSWGLAT